MKPFIVFPAVATCMMFLCGSKSAAQGLRTGQEYQNNVATFVAPGGGLVYGGTVYVFGTEGVSVYEVLGPRGHIFRVKATGQLYAHTGGYMDLPSDIVLNPGDRMPVLDNASYKVDGTSVYVDWSQHHTKYFEMSGCGSASEVWNIKNGGLILESATTPGAILTVNMSASSGINTDGGTANGLSGGSTESLLTSCRSKMRQGDLNGAFADASAAVDLASSNVAVVINIASSNLAVAYAQRGAVDYAMTNLDAAISDYNHAIELRTTNTWLYYRGKAKTRKNDFDGAIGDLTQAIQIRPSGLYFSERAWAYYQKENIPATRADLEKALEIVATDASSMSYKLFAQGLLDYLNGDFEGAFSSWQQHLQHYPSTDRPLLLSLFSTAKAKVGHTQ